MTNKDKETPVQSGGKSDFLTKMFYIVALYLSFLFSGILEEKLYKGKFVSDSDPDKKIKFSHPTIAIFLNSLFSYIISSIALSTMDKPLKTPFEKNDKLMLGTYYMISRASSENSLNYLDFISKIIGKSCKSVSSKSFNLIFSHCDLLSLQCTLYR